MKRILCALIVLTMLFSVGYAVEDGTTREKTYLIESKAGGRYTMAELQEYLEERLGCEVYYRVFWEREEISSYGRMMIFRFYEWEWVDTNDFCEYNLSNMSMEEILDSLYQYVINITLLRALQEDLYNTIDSDQYIIETATENDGVYECVVRYDINGNEKNYRMTVDFNKSYDENYQVILNIAKNMQADTY